MIHPTQAAPEHPPRLTQGLNAALIVLLSIQLLFFIIHALQVIRFPHDVDNEEGFLLAQSLQYAQGQWPYQSIHEPPHMVANYPPLYTWLVSWGTRFLGPTFAFGRSMTALCSLGVSFLIGRIVHRQSQQILASLVAALFFIGTYHVYSWGVYHRVDMLALLFSMLALAACESRRHWLWILAFCTLSLMTRQTTLAAPLAIGCFWISQRETRRAILLWLSLLAVVAGLSLLLNVLTQGEYFRHTVLYNKNAFEVSKIFDYVLHLWRFYAILCAFGWFYFLRGLQLRRFDVAFWFLIFSLGSMMLGGKVGSAANYVLEFMLALSWATGLVVAGVRSLAADTRGWLRVFLPTLLILQVFETFHLVHLPPLIDTRRFEFARTPDRGDFRQAETLEYIIARTPGPVLIEDAGVALRTGQPLVYQPFICTQLEQQGLWDPTPVIKRIQAREFDLILLHVNMDRATAASDRFSDRMINAIKSNYEAVEELDAYRPGICTALAGATRDQIRPRSPRVSDTEMSQGLRKQRPQFRVLFFRAANIHQVFLALTPGTSLSKNGKQMPDSAAQSESGYVNQNLDYSGCFSEQTFLYAGFSPVAQQGERLPRRRPTGLSPD